MTEDDLVNDLGRLLREGLVMVVVDEADEDLVPRFRVTARGHDVCEQDDEKLHQPSAVSEATA